MSANYDDDLEITDDLNMDDALACTPRNIYMDALPGESGVSRRQLRMFYDGDELDDVLPAFREAYDDVKARGDGPEEQFFITGEPAT